jgi:hypothetical protein
MTSTEQTGVDMPDLLELDDSLEEIQAFFETQGWTDGLPFIPPTVARVNEMYQYIDRDPKEVIATLAPRNGEATVERIAINAVMAGCRPEYLPVLITAVQAIEVPEFNLNGVQSTTHACTVAVFVSGPVAREIGINGGPNCFGQGTRANASIGRAMRLILLNVGGGTPGEGDKSTQGSPAKFSFCATETEASPWPPFHVEQGFNPEDSVVIVMAAEAPHNVIDGSSSTAVAVADSIADAMRGGGSNDLGFGRGNPMIAFGPEHAEVVAKDGWSRADVQRYIWENVRREFRPRTRPNLNAQTGSAAPAVSSFAPNQNPGVPFGERWIAEKPEDIFIIVAGGSGGHSSWIPSFGLMKSVVRRIEYADGQPVRRAMVPGGRH